MINSKSTVLNLPSEYENALKNHTRFQNLAWLFISLYVAISLVYLSGAEYKKVILFALGAPLAFFSTSWIKSAPWDQFRLFPVFIYTFCLPFFVSGDVKSDWISIGLIATCASISASMIRINFLAIAFIVTCVIAQYFAAKANVIGISDTKDTLLLNSYFSSLWVLLSGLASIVIIKRYLRYCEELDNGLIEVQEEYWNRSKKISQLNLKDHINLKLHGTILNTLCVAQNMDRFTSPQVMIDELRSELKSISEPNDFNFESKPNLFLIEKYIDFGRLDFELNLTEEFSIQNEVSEIVIELLREVILNINKHTDCKKVIVSFSSSGREEINVTVRQERLSTIKSNELINQAEAAMASKSMKRLCTKSNGEYKVYAFFDGSLIHSIKLNLVETDLGVLHKTKEIRGRALFEFVKNVSAISLIFAFLAIPAFIAQDVPFLMVAVVLTISVIHLYLLKTRSVNSLLVSILAVLPLTLIPHAFSMPDVCVRLESLPWLINSLLGAFLFGSFLASNPILRWGPGIVMFLLCLSANIYLPDDCSSLLNGTTPGIAIALIIAKLTLSRRDQIIKIDSELEEILREQSNVNFEIENSVDVSRKQLLDQVYNYTLDLEKGSTSKEDLDRLVALIRAFLLCSEKFEKVFFRSLFDWVYQRYQNRLVTSIDIFEMESYKNSLDFDFDSAFFFISNFYSGDNLGLTITVSDTLLIEIYSKKSIPSQDMVKLNNNSERISYFQNSQIG